jgi:hypothetical protein
LVTKSSGPAIFVRYNRGSLQPSFTVVLILAGLNLDQLESLKGLNEPQALEELERRRQHQGNNKHHGQDHDSSLSSSSENKESHAVVETASPRQQQDQLPRLLRQLKQLLL